MSRAALDVLLQALQQAVLAAAAEQEVGAAAQVFLQLSTVAAGWLLQRPLAHAQVPQGERQE